MNRLYQIIVCILRPLFFLAFPYRVSGRENRREGAAIVCANHSAAIDPFFVAFGFGINYQLQFMAKKEISKIPIVGWVLAKAGIFFVNRGANDVDAIRTAMKVLKSEGKIMIFPEGTRVAEENATAAKTGAVRLATKLNVPLVPVYIPSKKRLFSRVHVRIGAPFYADKSGGKSDSEMAEELMSKIYGLKDEMP